MRIVAGELKGRHIRAPKGAAVRPTTDRVKESLFAILRDDVLGARVLDLFAGSGGLGLEALSRGAAHVTFVDRHPACVRSIRRALAELDIPTDRAHAICGDGPAMLAEFEERRELFDLVFMDPPYDSFLAHEALQKLGMSKWLLTPDATVVVEHSRRATLPDFYGSLTRVRVKRYGDSAISFYREVVTRAEPDAR